LVEKEKVLANKDVVFSGERYIEGKVVQTEFELYKLGEICDVRDGTHDSPKYVLDGYPLITSKNIIDGKIDFTNVNLISKEDLDKVNKRSFVEDGDLIMPMIGTIGNPIIVKKDREFGIKNVALIKANENSRINNVYLKYILGSNVINEHFVNEAKGVAQKYLSLGFLRDLEIPLPPVEIQEQIVAEIEGYQKIIDGAKMVVENYKPTITINPEWDVVELGDSEIEIIDGDRGKNYPKKEEFSEKGFCLFLSTKNVRDNGFLFNDLSFITEEKDNLLRKGKLKRNDIVLTTRGTIGNIAIYSPDVKFEHIRINSGMLLLRVNPETLNSMYIYKLFQTEFIQNQFKEITSGAAQPQLPIHSLISTKIPLPPLEEQTQIVERIEQEQALVNANKQLIFLFEQKIKDKINEVWGVTE
jgi:restriction endonuclease S subunit